MMKRLLVEIIMVVFTILLFLSCEKEIGIETNNRISANVESNAADFKFTLTPNPTTDVVKIQIEGCDDVIIINIVKINGEILYSTKNSSGGMYIDFSNVESGVYYIQIVGNGVNSIRKLYIGDK